MDGRTRMGGICDGYGDASLREEDYLHEDELGVSGVDHTELEVVFGIYKNDNILQKNGNSSDEIRKLKVFLPRN